MFIKVLVFIFFLMIVLYPVYAETPITVKKQMDNINTPLAQAEAKVATDKQAITDANTNIENAKKALKNAEDKKEEAYRNFIQHRKELFDLLNSLYPQLDEKSEAKPAEKPVVEEKLKEVVTEKTQQKYRVWLYSGKFCKECIVLKKEIKKYSDPNVEIIYVDNPTDVECQRVGVTEFPFTVTESGYTWGGYVSYQNWINAVKQYGKVGQ